MLYSKQKRKKRKKEEEWKKEAIPIRQAQVQCMHRFKDLPKIQYSIQYKYQSGKVHDKKYSPKYSSNEKRVRRKTSTQMRPDWTLTAYPRWFDTNRKWDSDTEKAWTEKRKLGRKWELDQTQTQRSKQQWTTKQSSSKRQHGKQIKLNGKPSVKTSVLIRHVHNSGISTNRWKEVVAPKQPLI